MGTVTYTRTHTFITFANPFLTCDQCGGWVPKWHNDDRCGCDASCWNEPCGHKAGVTSVCPSWGPVDGCQCRKHLGNVPHDTPDTTGETETPMANDMRDRIADATRAHYLELDETAAMDNNICVCRNWVDVFGGEDWDAHLADAVMEVVGPELDRLRVAVDPSKVGLVEKLVRSSTRLVQIERDAARAERDALQAARCPSCDHLTTGHQQDGCWYAVTTGTAGRDLMCPCTVPAAAFAPTACRGCATSLATCWAEGARCCDACAHPTDTTDQTRGDE